MLKVSKKFFKHLEKLKESDDYKEALMEDGSILVRPHHKPLYRLFLDNTTGEVASLLRLSLTARESFRVWTHPYLIIRVQKQTFTQNQ